MREQTEQPMGKSMSVREKLQITDTNLARLDTEAAEHTEKREALLAEKLRAVLSGVGGGESEEYRDEVFRSIIRDEHFPDEFRRITERDCRVPEDAVLPELAAARLAQENRMEQISLCRMLAHAKDAAYRQNDSGRSPDERDRGWRQMIADLIRDDNHGEDDPAHELDVRAPRHAGERIAYLKNTYTDTAYDTFADALPHCVPAYYSDFPGVCEALYYGRATACILPLENSSDGKLLRFYSLLTKYDLRIAGVCSVSAEDSDSATKYALLRKSVTVPGREESSELFCECRIILEEDMTLSRVLSAADAYGMALSRADSVPNGYGDGGDTYDLIFRFDEEGDLPAMLTYLYLMTPQFTLLGIYPYY